MYNRYDKIWVLRYIKLYTGNKGRGIIIDTTGAEINWSISGSLFNQVVFDVVYNTNDMISGLLAICTHNGVILPE